LKCSETKETWGDSDNIKGPLESMKDYWCPSEGTSMLKGEFFHALNFSFIKFGVKACLDTAENGCASKYEVLKFFENTIVHVTYKDTHLNAQSRSREGVIE